MALSANTVVEVRANGSDTNGGGFVTGASGTDWSQQAAAQYSVTDGVTAGTTTITSATANFGTDVVGNILYVAGGTGSVAAGWYQITARTNSTTITVDRSTGLTAGTGVTLKIGGALASPAIGSLAATVAGMTIWVRGDGGTYTISSASTNVTGGCVSLSASVSMRGYNSTRGDYGTRPLLQADGTITTFTLLAVSTFGLVESINVDGNNRTASRGIASASQGIAVYCGAMNCTNNGFSGSATFCFATGCSTQVAFSASSASFCVAYSNTVSGFSAGANATISWCLSINNSGATSDGFQVASNQIVANCTAYGNGRHGFLVSNRSTKLFNCVSYGNVNGFSDGGNGYSQPLFYNCAAGGNITADYVSPIGATQKVNVVTLTANPFTNAAGGDFSLNNTAGGGALLRGAGIPGAFPAISTTGDLDIGAAQHAAAPSGGRVQTLTRGLVG